MLTHAIESFQHGVEHFLDGKPTSRKFALLHLDHAIELFLKERVVLLGKSIYKSDGQTLSFHETLSSLKDVEIKEKPRLQEIHDLRNTIQHKGITPDEATTDFYVQVGYEFIRRFVSQELGLVFGDLLSQRTMRLMEGESAFFPPSDYTYLPSVDYFPDFSPVENVIRAYTSLEKFVKSWQEANPTLGSRKNTMLTLAAGNGYNREQTKKFCDLIVRLRNRVVHTDYVPSKEEVMEYVDGINAILHMMVVRAEKD